MHQEIVVCYNWSQYTKNDITEFLLKWIISIINYVPTWPISLLVYKRERHFPIRSNTLMGFCDAATADRRIGRLQRGGQALRACDKFTHLTPSMYRRGTEKTRAKGRNGARGSQKMRVASRVTSEHGLACSALGVRPPSLGLVLSNALWLHTPADISIYLRIYPPVHTDAVYTLAKVRTDSRGQTNLLFDSIIPEIPQLRKLRS